MDLIYVKLNDILRGDPNLDKICDEIKQQLSILKDKEETILKENQELKKSLEEVKKDTEGVKKEFEKIKRIKDTLEKENDILKQGYEIIKHDEDMARKENEILKKELKVLKKELEVIKKENEVDKKETFVKRKEFELMKKKSEYLCKESQLRHHFRSLDDDEIRYAYEECPVYKVNKVAPGQFLFMIDEGSIPEKPKVYNPFSPSTTRGRRPYFYMEGTGEYITHYLVLCDNNNTRDLERIFTTPGYDDIPEELVNLKKLVELIKTRFKPDK